MPSAYRRRPDDIGRIVDALDGHLRQYPGLADLASGETWL